MSYDVHLAPESDAEDYFMLNHTSNTAKMMVAVLGDEAGIKMINGKKGSEVADCLHEGVVKLIKDAEEYRHLEASNGWGTVETTKNFLRDIWELAIRFPEDRFEVTC